MKNDELIKACQRAYEAMVAHDLLTAQKQSIAAKAAASSPAAPAAAAHYRWVTPFPCGLCSQISRDLPSVLIEMHETQWGRSNAGNGCLTLSLFCRRHSAQAQTAAAAGIEPAPPIPVDSDAASIATSRQPGTPPKLIDVIELDAKGAPTPAVRVSTTAPAMPTSVPAPASAPEAAPPFGLPLPEYELVEAEEPPASPAAASPSEVKLVVSLPLVPGMSAVDLQISPAGILLTAPGLYAPLAVQLPAGIDDAAARAKFDKRSHKLTVVLPRK